MTDFIPKKNNKPMVTESQVSEVFQQLTQIVTESQINQNQKKSVLRVLQQVAQMFPDIDQETSESLPPTPPVSEIHHLCSE